MRTAAEYDNYRKRTAREKDATFNNGVTFAVTQLLPVVDTLEMAAAAPTEDENYKKGVEMTLTKCVEAFGKLGIRGDRGGGQAVRPRAAQRGHAGARQRRVPQRHRHQGAAEGLPDRTARSSGTRWSRWRNRARQLSALQDRFNRSATKTQDTTNITSCFSTKGEIDYGKDHWYRPRYYKLLRRGHGGRRAGCHRERGGLPHHPVGGRVFQDRRADGRSGRKASGHHQPRADRFLDQA